LETFEEEDNKYSYAIRLLKKEMAIIFVYVFLVFACTRFGLMNSNITSLTSYRWLIEASFAPLAAIMALVGSYFAGDEDFFDKYQTLYFVGFMLKVPLFFVIFF
jgi:hypothetical protein